MNNMNFGGGRGRGSRALNAPLDQKQTKEARTRAIARMSRYLLRYKKTVLLALLLMLSSNLLALAGPALSGRAIDAIKLGKGAVELHTVWIFVLLLAIFYTVSGALSYLLSVLMIHLSQKIVYTMRREVF